MIDAGFLQELDRFRVIMKKHIHSKYSGDRESKTSGSGLTFRDHRKYERGDDVRTVDWRVYARTEEYIIKRYEEERNMQVHIVIDSSGSMNYGQKFDYASMIGLGFAYIGLKNNEKFEISTFNETLEKFKPRKGATQINSLITQLNNVKLQGTSKFSECLKQYKQAIKSKSFVVIISDCLFDISEIKNALSLFKKSDVILIQVLDKTEKDLSLNGDVVLTDLERPLSKIRTFIGARLKQNYQNKLTKHIAEIKNVCDTLGVKFASVSTDTPVFDVFYDVLN